MADKSVLSFVQATQRVGGALSKTLRTGVQEAALFTKRSIEAQPGYPHAPLRGTGRRGKPGRRASVRYDVRGSTNPTALLEANGPFQLIERDVKRHLVGIRYSRASKVKAAAGSRIKYNAKGRVVRGGSVWVDAEGPRKVQGKPLRIGGQWVMGPVPHPGSKGRHPFENGVRAAEPFVMQIFRRQTMLALSANLNRTF
jgi:hypothetical protein